MTKEELDAAQVLCDNATPAPWVWANDDMYNQAELDAWLRWSNTEPLDIDTMTVATAIIETDSGCYGPRENDRAFIAAARTLLPRLIAEVRRLQNQVQSTHSNNVSTTQT